MVFLYFSELTLTLLVALVHTDHAQDALAPHQLAVATDFFYRCLNSHNRYSFNFQLVPLAYLARKVILAFVKS